MSSTSRDRDMRVEQLRDQVEQLRDQLASANDRAAACAAQCETLRDLLSRCVPWPRSTDGGVPAGEEPGQVFEEPGQVFEEPGQVFAAARPLPLTMADRVHADRIAERTAARAEFDATIPSEAQSTGSPAGVSRGAR